MMILFHDVGCFCHTSDQRSDAIQYAYIACAPHYVSHKNNGASALKRLFERCLMENAMKPLSDTSGKCRAAATCTEDDDVCDVGNCRQPRVPVGNTALIFGWHLFFSPLSKSLPQKQCAKYVLLTTGPLIPVTATEWSISGNVKTVNHHKPPDFNRRY